MMKKRWIVTILAVLLALTVCGCGKAQEQPLKGSDYLPSHQPALDVGIIDRLPADQVSAIMGVDMTASGPYEEGTWVMYLSADGTKQVSVSMKNTTAELYDVDVAGLMADSEAIASLGERAIWHTTSGQVICFHNGYSIAISITDPTIASTKGLCEAVAGKLIANIG